MTRVHLGIFAMKRSFQRYFWVVLVYLSNNEKPGEELLGCMTGDKTCTGDELRKCLKVSVA
jgi:hypothetical protein